MTAETFWNTQYDDHPTWGDRVNPLLMETAEPLPAGAALDLGCGAGGDTIWLARRGWQVTAVDISSTAVAKVGALARELEAAGLRGSVTAVQHDLSNTFPDGTFDLVSAQYLQTRFDFPRSTVLRTAAQALRPGGLLLLVDHGSIAPWSWNQDKNAQFPTAGDLAAELDLDPEQWPVRRADSPQREAVGPGGETATVTDTVLVIQRADR
ncbi:class I SAM-dependent methyltransferase [Kribbella italica]|uniref:SAM-dependent methyltransferase n=1 Tax=Kribbella italica TaxID=1540520 RepID=A0A7W9JGA5_9ACTN|nr:class I SAM-dependent methyltransferase [Kribbella italica]MBB5841415.1 SAM-dependent methyltransferase [Kribbella italica]